jgi:hypothetical protein
MKLTLLLLSLAKISLGYVCENDGFKSKQQSNVEYQGKFYPVVNSREFVMPQSKNLNTEILAISNGSLTFKDKDKLEYKQNYFECCVPSGTLYSKTECL